MITIYGKEAIYQASENDKRDKLGKCSVCKETNAYMHTLHVCIYVNKDTIGRVLVARKIDMSAKGQKEREREKE